MVQNPLAKILGMVQNSLRKFLEWCNETENPLPMCCTPPMSKLKTAWFICRFIWPENCNPQFFSSSRRYFPSSFCTYICTYN